MLGFATRPMSDLVTPDRGPAADYVFTGGSLPAGVTLTRASSATRINASGVLETVASDVARFEYDPVTLACRGLLREGAATNLLTWSDDVTNAAYIKLGGSISANAAIAPDGTLTADKFVEDTSGVHIMYRSVTLTAADYTFSVYLKQGERAWAVLRLDPGGALEAFASFDLANGALGTVAGAYRASITPAPFGYWRCTVTALATAGIPWYPCIYSAQANNSQNYVGDGVSGLYVWGHQLELGSAPTSYIPTTGSAATRAADVVTVNTGCAGAGEVAMCAEIDMLGTPAVPYANYLVGSNETPSIAWHSNGYAYAVITNIAALANQLSSPQIGRHKLAASMKSGNSLITVDGAAASAGVTASSVLMPATTGLGNFDAAVAAVYERVRIWPRTMSPAELQAVTT